MTDKEITKALECCIKLNAEPRNWEICKKDCPYKFNCCDREKGISVEKDILDLINRQQAEIENARIGVKSYKGKYESAVKTARELKFVIAEKQADIEVWKKINQRLYDEMEERRKEDIGIAKGYARIEATKEFAERLNKEAEKVEIDREGDFVEADDEIYDTVAIWCKTTSDNILKEMVGEGK